MRFLILTTSLDTLKWKSLPIKISAIQEALGKDWTVTLEYKETKPLILEGRVDHSWYKNFVTPYLTQGFDVVALHLSDKQRKEWGLKTTLRGSNFVSDVFYGDFYFWADEKTKRQGFDQFWQTCLHEFSHEYFQKTKLKDITHKYHNRHKNIAPLLKTFDWKLYSSKTQPLKLSFLKTLLMSLMPKPKPVVLNNDLLPLVKRQVDKVLVDMEMLGHEMRMTQGYRPIAEQDKLYAQGRTTAGPIVTNARGGESYHNHGTAADFVFRKEGYNASEALWQTFGAIGKKHGFSWGGDWKSFKDYPHLEMTFGHSFKDFQNKLVDLNKYK